MGPNDQLPQLPSLAQLKQYRVNLADQVEGIRGSLYDFQTYAFAGTTTQYTFFQVPIGQGNKTKEDTNMEAAGSLPNPKNFLIQGVELFLFPGSAISVIGALAVQNWLLDMNAMFKKGYLEIFIGSKTYLTEAPIGRFPPANGLSGFAARSDVTTAAATSSARDGYAVWAGKPYELSPWILLEPTQNFNVTLNFPTTAALPSGVDARIGVVLRGLLYRNSQ
jgi:hypothetical protein